MRHGDLVRDGDEFNREPYYWCAYCGFAHGKAYGSCFDALPGTRACGAGDDPLTAVIDRQLEIERKARAWDEWRRRVGKANTYVTWEGEALALLLERLERTA